PAPAARPARHSGNGAARRRRSDSAQYRPRHSHRAQRRAGGAARRRPRTVHRGGRRVRGRSRPLPAARLMEPRATPFTLVFDLLAADRFPAIREELTEGREIDRFLLAPAAVELLRELRPDEGLGDAADDFVAFVHAAYCHWDD